VEVDDDEEVEGGERKEEKYLRDKP